MTFKSDNIPLIRLRFNDTSATSVLLSEFATEIFLAFLALLWYILSVNNLLWISPTLFIFLDNVALEFLDKLSSDSNLHTTLFKRRKKAANKTRPELLFSHRYANMLLSMQKDVKCPRIF